MMWGSVPQIDDRVVVDDDLGVVIVHVKHSGVNGLVLVSFLVDGYFCSHHALEI